MPVIDLLIYRFIDLSVDDLQKVTKSSLVFSRNQALSPLASPYLLEIASYTPPLHKVANALNEIQNSALVVPL